MRVAEELRGISASFSVAAKRSSIGFALSRAIAFSLARRGPSCFDIFRRRLFFSIELFLAIRVSWVSAFEGLASPSLPEREVECRQQGARFVVGACGRADGNVHAPDFGCLVVVDFRENDVLL